MTKERNYGVIKVDNDRVKLYNSQTSYITINVGSPVNEARWVGDKLLVTMENGKVRQYTSQTSYTAI
jgi:hypothetical protein